MAAIGVDESDVALLEVAEHGVGAGDPHLVAVADAEVAAVRSDEREAVEVETDVLEVAEGVGRDGHGRN